MNSSLAPRPSCTGHARSGRQPGTCSFRQKQQQCRRRPRAAAASEAAAPAAARALIDASKLIIHPSSVREYFPAADLHATVFEHSNSPNQALWQRFERIWALQINDNLVDNGAGSCVLLVAYDPSRAPPDILQAAAAAAAAAAADGLRSQAEPSPPAAAAAAQLPELPEAFVFPKMGYWLSRLVQQDVWARLGTTFDELGIIGVAQVDTFGDLVPPKALDVQRDGAWGWIRREGIGYISNVAVSPAARRCGVAARLMAAAEDLAASWGCSRAALHCNPSNAAALGLYRRLRYRRAGLEAPWMPYLQGRAPDRCMLMLKRLTAQLQQHQAAEAAAEAAAESEAAAAESEAAAAEAALSLAGFAA